MSVEERFRVRAQDVSEYLKSLQSLERVHNTPGRSFYRATAAITASRASAFIMIYNCIEFGAREALVGLRQEILAGSNAFTALKDYWQEEIARAHFRDRLTQGTNHDSLIRDVAKFAPGIVDWRSDMHVCLSQETSTTRNCCALSPGSKAGGGRRGLVWAGLISS
jgi:hypothetical protein